MTGHLWVEMIRDLKREYKIRNVPFDLSRTLLGSDQTNSLNPK
jgi:hypothetical protein